MMKILLPIAAIAFTAVAAFSQSDRDLEQLLKNLEQLAEKRTQNKDAALRKVLPQVQKAASSGPSAVGAYVDAYRAVELKGNTAQASDHQAWREQNRDILNSNEFRTAAQLHAEYLALTLERATSEKPEEFVQPSLDYLDRLATAWTRIFSRVDGKPHPLQTQMLQGNVREGLLAKHWELAPFLPPMKDWELTPGNAEGILEKNIRPILRKDKDKRLLDTWDWQMKFEEGQFPRRDRSHAFEMFQTRRIPDLQMRKAADRAALGEQIPAARDAVAVLTKFPEHPSFDQWVETVRGWLVEAKKKSEKNPPAVEDSAETPAPEPTDAG